MTQPKFMPATGGKVWSPTSVELKGKKVNLLNYTDNEKGAHIGAFFSMALSILSIILTVIICIKYLVPKITFSNFEITNNVMSNTSNIEIAKSDTPFWLICVTIIIFSTNAIIGYLFIKANYGNGFLSNRIIPFTLFICCTFFLLLFSSMSLLSNFLVDDEIASDWLETQGVESIASPDFDITKSGTYQIMNWDNGIQEVKVEATDTRIVLTILDAKK
jgi:hypothetical protein